MNIKVNKLQICILVVFVVLLFANVQANELSTTAVSEIAGNGTKDNPYIIDASAGGTLKTIKFKYNSLPFYFVVKDGQEGSYEIFHESAEQTVTFRFVDSVNNGIKVMLDLDEYNDVMNWQLGVETILNQGADLTVPTYAIYEEISYYSSSQEADETYNSYIESQTNYYSSQKEMEEMLNQMISDDFFGDYRIDLDGGGVSEVYKTTKLYNAVVKGPVLVSKPDHYFFTTSKDYDDIDTLLTPMDYNKKLSNPPDDFDIYENKTNLTTSPPMIRIRNKDINDFTKGAKEGINIVYKFAGNTNTALDDTGEKNDIESLITRLLVSIGDNLLLVMLRNALGDDLSIDSLIFNRFEATKIELYKKSSNSINQVLRNVINYWYGVLSKITYIAYLIIFVYIGIMIILSAGTEKQSKMRSYLGNWVVGLVILLFLPTYGIPILFDLNDAFVKFIGRNTSTMKTYYNNYDVLLSGDIPGSDSATVSIEELLGMRDELQQSYNEFSKNANDFMNDLRGEIKTVALNQGGLSYMSLASKDFAYIDSIMNSNYKNYQYNRGLGKTSGETLLLMRQSLEKTIQNISNSKVMSRVGADALREVLINQGYLYKLLEKYEDVYISEHDIGVIEEMINVVQTDIMGQMRVYANKYQKLVFAFIWYMLLFQLIGLTFLYFKRIFVIAILIAIFPLIMLFYCIDKITDGTAQTFSLWFKELLANIFIQSVHAVIYTILVEMGLAIYKNDPGNWLFLVAAMLMLIPAEGIMKELFGLNGSTLGAIGGSLMKTAVAIGAIKTLATSWRGKNDASMQEKNNKRFDKLQRRQNRADTRAKIRETKRAGATYRKDDKKGHKKGELKNYTGDKFDKDKLSAYGKVREGIYKAGTAARTARAKVSPTLDNAARIARNVTATTAGALYGMSGGDVESLAQGAQFAKEFSGATKNLKGSDVNIKTELKSALDRKKKRK